MSSVSLWSILLLAACTRQPRSTTPSTRTELLPNVQVGACGDPTHDGVISDHPRLEHADRDLDSDGRAETIVVDRNKCTPEANCYWNVFVAPREPGACARYIGTFEGAALEPLASKGDDNMTDVRAYWNQHGGRLLLQSYRFVRGGYRVTDVLQCKREADDRLECASTDVGDR
ncbi:MAG: hypothetical protein ACM31C_11450 [Acidobacteriota bacterium]